MRLGRAHQASTSMLLMHLVPRNSPDSAQEKSIARQPGLHIPFFLGKHCVQL